MALSVTAPYIALLTLYAIVLGANVSIYRAKSGVSILHGDDMVLAEKVRRHANFTENVPLALVVMAAAEIQGLGATWLHIAGLLLLAGRLAHPFGIHHENPNNVLRGVGSAATTLSMLICAISLFLNWFTG